ncbi:hypothetical protein [Acidovorax sp. FG27]|uniref:PulJ/GspJ family protein n=1 Tax=Acidovorax sp. FG27 TaxID=3133652 RepID=UPI0030E94D35
MKRQSAGFSLLELTLGLAVTGMVGLAAWQLIPASRSVATGDTPAQQLRTAQDAVEGFALRRSRLPCPATAGGDGQEQCGTARVGELPWRTLGVPRGDTPLRYGVYRSTAADLLVASNTYVPYLPIIAVLPAGYSAVQINGLDLCQSLRTAAASPSVSPDGLDAGGVPVAYALAHPGANRQFDGGNVGTAFALPNQASTTGFDDRTVATGLGELASRLNCPVRLAEASGSARSAFAAYDLDRDAEMFLQFRRFAYDVRVTNRKLAESALGLATADLAIAIGSSASAISLAANSLGVETGLVVAAVLGVTAATGGVVAASVLLVQAQADEALAGRQAASAQTVRNQYSVDYQAAFAAAAASDRKGLIP